MLRNLLLYHLWRAKDILKNKCKYDVKDYHDFEPGEEDALPVLQENRKIDYVFVTEYPSDKRPFYAMDDPENPGFTLYLICCSEGLEVTTGGQRINNYEMQVEKMKSGMKPDDFY